MPDIDIGWNVRLDELQNQLKKSSNLSNDEVRRMVNGLQGQFKRATGEATKAAKAAEREWAQSMNALQGAAEKTLGMLGGPFGTLGDLAFDLGGKVNGAGGAIGSMGVAAAGAAVGVAAFTVGIIELANKASEATIRLKEQGLAAKIPSEAIISQREYKTALEGLSTQVDIFTAKAGGPALKSVAFLSNALTGLLNRVDDLALPIGGLLTQFVELQRSISESSLMTLITFGGNKLAPAGITAIADAFSKVAEEGKMAAQVYENAAALEKDVWFPMPEELLGTTPKTADPNATKTTTTTVSTRVAAAEDEARQLAEIEAAIAADAKSYEDKKVAMRQATYDAKVALDAENAALEEQRHQRRLEMEREFQAAYIAAVEEARAMAMAQADAMASSLGAFNELATSVYETVAAKGEDATMAERRAAMTAFALSKSLAISQALISGTLLAINTAAAPGFASLAPFGTALAFGAAAATTAATIAQIAATKPPSFARGGMVDDPDHRLIQARADEAVLTGRGVSALGGREGVEAVNRGLVTAGGAGGGTVVHMYVDGRRLAGAAVSEWGSLLSGRPLGRRPAYG